MEHDLIFEYLKNHRNHRTWSNLYYITLLASRTNHCSGLFKGHIPGIFINNHGERDAAWHILKDNIMPANMCLSMSPMICGEISLLTTYETSIKVPTTGVFRVLGVPQTPPLVSQNTTSLTWMIKWGPYDWKKNITCQVPPVMDFLRIIKPYQAIPLEI